jgi:hypothetical protein
MVCDKSRRCWKRELLPVNMLINTSYDAGDDWFYFEDITIEQQSKNDDTDIVFKTRSGDVTSTITFLFEAPRRRMQLRWSEDFRWFRSQQSR